MGQVLHGCARTTPAIRRAIREGLVKMLARVQEDHRRRRILLRNHVKQNNALGTERQSKRDPIWKQIYDVENDKVLCRYVLRDAVERTDRRMLPSDDFKH